MRDNSSDNNIFKQYIDIMKQEEWMKMYSLIGAAMEVYNQLGRGMEEPIYQEAMEMELTERNIAFEREKVLHTYYKGKVLKKVYEADFVCDNIIIEFKSVNSITSDHRAQLFNYLRITKSPYGIIVNYGENHFHAERYTYDETRNDYVLLAKDTYRLYIDGRTPIVR